MHISNEDFSFPISIPYIKTKEGHMKTKKGYLLDVVYLLSIHQPFYVVLTLPFGLLLSCVRIYPFYDIYSYFLKFYL